MQFLCFTFAKKRLKKNFTLQMEIRAVGRVPKVARVFTGSVSQIASPLECDCQQLQ